MDFKIKNFTIEKFNNDVNNSGDLRRKYESWAEYRRNITDFIANSIENENNDSVIVFGAGECNDLDIAFLTKKFNKVVLTDIDIKSVAEGIKRQNIQENLKKKISIVQADYTGLREEGFFEVLSEISSERQKKEKIIQYIKSTIEKVKTDKILSEHKGIYDAVIVLPTYTQLVYTQMETMLRILYEYKIYTIEDLNKILTAMHYSMPVIIKNYNNLIISMTKGKGVLLVFSDAAEITDRKTAENIASKLGDKSFVESYLEKDFCEFGILGVNDLKLKSLIIHEEYRLWPFNDEKQYLVELIAGTVQKNNQDNY